MMKISFEDDKDTPTITEWEGELNDFTRWLRSVHQGHCYSLNLVVEDKGDE